MENLSIEQILEDLRELNVFAIRDEMDQLFEESEKINACLEKIRSEINGLIKIRNKLPDGSPQKIDIDIRLEHLYAEKKPYDNIVHNIFERKIVLDKKRIEAEEKALELLNELKISVGSEELFAEKYPQLVAAEKSIKESLANNTVLQLDKNKEYTNKKEVSNPKLDGIDAETSGKIHMLLVNNQKIEAIKVYMEKTGVGLAEAKDVIDKYTEQPNLNNSPNNTSPNTSNDITQNQDNNATSKKDGEVLGTIISIAIFVVFFLLLFGKYLF